MTYTPSVLISSAGRRTSLLHLFQNAAHSRGWRVIAGDHDSLAPTLFLADAAVQLPAVLSKTYIPKLLELVEVHNIRLIVPVIDTELLLLAQSAELFCAHQCRVLISSERFVSVVRDKWWSGLAFSNRGIATPTSWLPESFHLPELPERVFVKPRNGSSSMNAIATTRDQLAAILPQVPNALIQEELLGTEITIDALLDFTGIPVHYVPRVRIRTIGGESIQGRTLADLGLRDWITECLMVSGDMGAIGVLTLQAFLTDRGPVLTEINPRFGGGFPLSYAAGAHYPEWVLDLVEGKPVEPRIGAYTTDLYMTRYHCEHFLQKSELNGNCG